MGGDVNAIEELLIKHNKKGQPIGRQNAKFKQIKQLLSGQRSDCEHQFAVEGIWAHQRINQTNIAISSLFICPELIYSNETIQMVDSLLERIHHVYFLSEALMKILSEREKPDGLVSIGYLPYYDKDQLDLSDHAMIVIVDGLEQPGNVGTILRTCDGAGVDAVIICNQKTKLTHPKLMKASMGAVFSLPVITFSSVEDCQKWLNKHRFTVYMADSKAKKTYKSYEFKRKTALVIGSERYGISQEWYGPKSQLLSIPMHGICDSLNAGVAAAILIYEIRMKLVSSERITAGESV